MNKKGAELTIGTLVIIVLAIVVLVVIIVGFTSGWGNLWGRMTGFFSGSDNIDTVVQSCSVACSTKAENDFCRQSRDLRNKEGIALPATPGTGDKEVKATGKEVKDNSGNSQTPREYDKVTGTCQGFAAGYSTLGFDTCGDLCS